MEFNLSRGLAFIDYDLKVTCLGEIVDGEFGKNGLSANNLNCGKVLRSTEETLGIGHSGVRYEKDDNNTTML